MCRPNRHHLRKYVMFLTLPPKPLICLVILPLKQPLLRDLHRLRRPPIRHLHTYHEWTPTPMMTPQELQAATQIRSVLTCVMTGVSM